MAKNRAKKICLFTVSVMNLIITVLLLIRLHLDAMGDRK